MHPRPAFPRTATLRPPRAAGLAPCRARSGARPVLSASETRPRPQPPTQGFRLGARRGPRGRARGAPLLPESGARRSLRRPVRGRPSGAAEGPLDRGGQGACSASLRRPIRSRRRISRYRAWAAFTRITVRFECYARRAERLRRPAQVPGGKRDLGLGDHAPCARQRLARAVGARRPAQQGPARAKSPSCAIAVPRSARAGGSSRRAIRFSAPRGSPTANARAAAVISESIEIPSRLSLPALGSRQPNLAHPPSIPGDER